MPWANFMGDLRNKYNKDRRDAEHEAFKKKLEERFPRKGEDRRPPVCQCGLTCYEVPAMWVFYGDDRWSPAMVYCPACLPYEQFALVTNQIANLPDTEE